MRQQRLTSLLQEMQEQMNSMSDSGEAQEVESNKLQWEIVLRFQSICNDPKFSFQFSTFDSLLNHPQRIQSDDVQRERGAVPVDGGTELSQKSEDRQNQGTIPMPTLAGRPWTTSSTMPVELPQKYMVGQQGQQISDLQFHKFASPQSFFSVENSIQKSSHNVENCE